MQKLFFRSVVLAGFAFALACSSDDDDPTSPGATPGSAGEPPATETNVTRPAEEGANGGGTGSADTATDDGELQPALPVVENPDHEQMLSSDDPALAANKRLVYDAWRTLIEARDTTAAEPLFREDYIQHNPNADTGRAGVFAFFSSLGEPLPVQERVQAKLVAIVAEGDYVAIARVDEYSEPRPYTTTWFDLFRIEEGAIAEHWDHGRLPAGGSPRGYVPPTESPDQAAALASTDPALADNKQLVHEMWRTLLDAQQVEEAPNYLADGYVQHNPQANTGLLGFLTFFRQFAQPQAVQPEIANFIHIVAEGDLVVLATVRPYDDAAAPYTTTWFDMFRVDDGLLVEHWDTATLPVP
ncbi:MAG TPA: nuclear transport factor 2 family protein [Polyangiaceae bacterium]|nr:nuclear transport factor 2 family protein [Polyangiaceae bacterium]